MRAFMCATTLILVALLSGTIGCNSLSRPGHDDVVKGEVDRIIDTIKVTHRASLSNDGCTADNIVYRREYGSLSKTERLDYVNSVKCLQALPARTPAKVSAGTRSRFDDFVLVHIQRTLDIHYTGNFQHWHRWFVYLYEKALRDECGYKGYQPYWDWPKYADAPQDSPIFNGDPYSLGGNGEYIPGHNGSVIVPPGSDPIQLAPGVGGGYVRTGPFANMTVNLGPVGGVAGVEPGPDGGLGYNPRGLKRDVGPALNQRYANYTTVLGLLSKPNITEYRALSEGTPNTVELGPHGGAHYVINGDPGGDLYTSPGEPAFWLHHSMVDRMWALWQAMNPDVRNFQMDDGRLGHITWDNNPSSRLTSLDDVIDMGYAGPSTTIRQVASTTSGELCYFYD
ncbi:tyrosinase central domain containing protein [Apiospora arundinis]